MIALLQRVTAARVWVDGRKVGEIDAGLLVFLAIQKQDAPSVADQMVQRILGYRLFADEEGKMNKSVKETRGGVLLVPQFTLAADTQKGLRPNFSPAAAPDQSRVLFAYCLDKLKDEYDKVSAGVFAAKMQVQLVNDGPVTFWLEL